MSVTRFRLLLVALLTAALALGAGVVWVAAAPKASTAQVNVCVSSKTNTVVSASSKGKCPRGSKKTAINKLGPQGDAGVQGPVGPQGPVGTSITGPQGPSGPTGQQGPAGTDGVDGDDGADGQDGEGSTPEVLDGGAP